MLRKRGIIDDFQSRSTVYVQIRRLWQEWGIKMKRKQWNHRIKSIKHKDRYLKNITLDYMSTFITNLNMQSSIWVLYLAYCGLNLAQIGLVEGIYHATSIIFEIPSGAVADLLGRKKSMVLSRICIALSCMIMLFAQNFWHFALGFMVQALGNNLNSGSEEALVYDSMKAAGQEARYMSVCGRLNVIIEESQGIATVAGGILAEFSYFWCYSACLVIAALALLPVILMVEAPYVEEQGRQRSVWEVVAVHFRTCFEILRSDRRIFGRPVGTHGGSCGNGGRTAGRPWRLAVCNFVKYSMNTCHRGFGYYLTFVPNRLMIVNDEYRNWLLQCDLQYGIQL